jgi:hypothetical protein
MAIKPKSFLRVILPSAANLAIDPVGVDFEA